MLYTYPTIFACQKDKLKVYFPDLPLQIFQLCHASSSYWILYDEEQQSNYMSFLFFVVYLGIAIYTNNTLKTMYKRLRHGTKSQYETNGEKKNITSEWSRKINNTYIHDNKI